MQSNVALLGNRQPAPAAKKPEPAKAEAAKPPAQSSSELTYGTLAAMITRGQSLMVELGAGAASQGQKRGVRGRISSIKTTGILTKNGYVATVNTEEFGWFNKGVLGVEVAAEIQVRIPLEGFADGSVIGLLDDACLATYAEYQRSNDNTPYVNWLEARYADLEQQYLRLKFASQGSGGTASG